MLTRRWVDQVVERQVAELGRRQAERQGKAVDQLADTTHGRIVCLGQPELGVGPPCELFEQDRSRRIRAGAPAGVERHDLDGTFDRQPQPISAGDQHSQVGKGGHQATDLAAGRGDLFEVVDHEKHGFVPQCLGQQGEQIDLGFGMETDGRTEPREQQRLTNRSWRASWLPAAGVDGNAWRPGVRPRWTGPFRRTGTRDHGPCGSSAGTGRRRRRLAEPT